VCMRVRAGVGVCERRAGDNLTKLVGIRVGDFANSVR
jgi:hypothetical protein